MRAARTVLPGLVVLAFAVLLAAPAAAMPSGNPGTPRHPWSPAPARANAPLPPAGPATSPEAALASRITSTLHADHVPAMDIHLPNFAPRTVLRNGTVTPTYSVAPAPMGIGDLGVADVNGTDVGTVSYTSSVEAQVTVNALNATYVEGDGANSISMQLNTVLTHVDLFGNTSNQFWIQNVPTYILNTHELTIVDNVWNFSSPSFHFTRNSMYSDDGVAVAPVYYYANGPAFYLPMPFTVRLWNNATVFHDRPTVYLNYSVTAANGTVYPGSYDRVEFNSTGLVKPTGPAPAPTFQIDGQRYGATGYLPNDAEIMIGGWNDGSTQSFSQLSATMRLQTEANGTHSFRDVPNALNYGFDTGETAEGIAEWSSTSPVDVAHLGSGPSLLAPLWGMVGAVAGHIDVALSIAPSNAFLFVSPGPTFRSGTAAWAPVSPGGAADFEISPGSYSARVLLSEYRPLSFALPGSLVRSVHLTGDPSTGVYTPLWAWGNGQLAAISQSGSGTAAHPYVLENNAGTIDPLFGEFNDFEFPVFPGIFLAYTTANVRIENPPSFLVTYSLPYERALSLQFGLPTANELPIETFNASRVALLDGAAIAGWEWSDDVGETIAPVILWNSTDLLVAGNTFDDQGLSLLVYGGTNTTIWGNDFVATSTVVANPANINGGTDPMGLLLGASGDLVYTNEFNVPVPAQTPTYDLTSYANAHYRDAWNITPQAASVVHPVLGVKLSGGLFGRGTQGGNFWSNYGSRSDPYGVTPYNDGGLLTNGGDFDPVLPYSIYAVTFTETGLTAGTGWSVTVDGTRTSSTGSTLVLYEPNGTFAYVLGHVAGFRAHPRIGAVRIVGGPSSVAVRFS